ncbi:predicted protein [Nematostella vectensis]|uniref:Uncharacterized protein n=1 Tax=Nematostella vectensis TaxID=45351 RepID=A7RRR4_NEMVE|nr:predicted protein [Nematostella vectensis]|eukprot:XP_001637871.1 predicted protein [Nematostella vectensis]
MTTAIQFISAVVTRIIFVGHAGLVVWMLVQTTPNGVVYWSLLTGLALLAIEAAFTLGYRKGFEHRYLWPSCFFYLCTMVPCVWIIELDMMQRRINKDESLPIFYIGSPIKKTVKEAADKRVERLKERIKRLHEEVEDRFTPKEQQTALKGYLKTHGIAGQRGYDPKTFIARIKPKVLELISQQKKPIKVKFIFTCGFIKEDPATAQIEEELGYFHTEKPEIVTESTDLSDLFDTMTNYLLGLVELFQKQGSGWQFDQVEYFDINIDPFEPLSGAANLIKSELDKFADWILSYVPEPIKKTVKEAADKRVERLKERIKRLHEEVEDRFTPKEQQTALKGYLKTHGIAGQRGYDPKTFIARIKPKVLELISQQKKPIKVKFIFTCGFIKEDPATAQIEEELGYFHTEKPEIVTESTDLSDLFDTMTNYLLGLVELFQKQGSGWQFDQLVRYTAESPDEDIPQLFVESLESDIKKIYDKFRFPKKGSSKGEPLEDDVEVKRESLAILASLGTTKEFLGVDMSLGDIKKLSAKDVEKYFVRYQTVLGKQVTDGLVESALQVVSQVISYVVPVDDTEALSKDLQNDELVKRELSNFAGLLVLKGGRMVALASALFRVAKHVKLTPSQETSNKLQEVSSTTEQTLDHT